MADERSEPSGDIQATAEFNQVINRWQGRSTRDLAYLDESDVREVSSRAYRVGESERAKVRPIFKKVLLTVPLWARGARFIRGLTDLTYGPDELSIIEQEKQKAQEREQQIKEEIGRGVFPWLAHTRHNERSVLNPYIVGFYQDDEGRIRTIHGEHYFKSQRQVESTIFAGRTEAKEVNLLAGSFQRVEGAEVMRGPHWNLLPQDLRTRFEHGEILVTTGTDLYSLTDHEVDQLSQSNNPSALLDHLDQKSRQSIQQGTNYHLLYYSDYRSNETGRTGVVMQAENGELKPLTVTVDGKEYVVEVKGCGMNSGGFGKMHHRTGRDIITGGAEREQAVNELHRLSENEGKDGPKAVGSILFNNQGYDQGYIIRLTPSTVRASYSDNECYPQVEEPQFAERVLQMYSVELVNQILAPNPKILDRSAHSENLLVWGNGQFTFTDFSDHVAFADKHYPHEENHGGYMTPKQMLEYYVQMVKEVPGYSVSRDQQQFYSFIMGAFRTRGVNIRLEDSDDQKMVAQRVWEGGMAYQVFKARRDNKYVAEGALDEFKEKSTNSFGRRDLAMDSADSFAGRLGRANQEMVTILNQIGPKISDTAALVGIDGLVTSLGQGNLVASLEQVDNVWQGLFKGSYENLTDQERESLRNAISYFGSFDYALVNPLQKYFEHEMDVIKGAKVSCLEQERGALDLAEQELKEKIQQFVDLVNGDPRQLYDFINNPDEVRRLVTFNFYGN